MCEILFCTLFSWEINYKFRENIRLNPIIRGPFTSKLHVPDPRRHAPQFLSLNCTLAFHSLPGAPKGPHKEGLWIPRSSVWQPAVLSWPGWLPHRRPWNPEPLLMEPLLGPTGGCFGAWTGHSMETLWALGRNKTVMETVYEVVSFGRGYVYCNVLGCW